MDVRKRIPIEKGRRQFEIQKSKENRKTALANLIKQWSVVESFDDLNDAVSAWNTLFLDVANRRAPIKKLRMKGTIKPWITKKLKEMMERATMRLRLLKDLELNEKSGTIIAG